MSVSIPPKFLALRQAALLLQADNFTPRDRTPWGGTKIAKRYKGLESQVVGESWEVSVEPQFPSRAAADGNLLSAWIAEDPAFFLGASKAGTRNALGSALLVKLLDTDDRLSLQIHPHGHEPFLKPDESGKPESWFVIEAEPDAGIYLGLADGVDERMLREAIAHCSSDVEQLLHFERVSAGDFFRIDAGTPHAIGPGLTLVEPQRVEPAKRGVTYRYYDWDRRYDQHGMPSVQGQPRALHLAEAFAVTNWRAERGAAFAHSVKTHVEFNLHEPLRLRPLLGSKAPLASELLEVSSCQGTGALALAKAKHLRALTVVAGHAALENSCGRTELRTGQSVVLPAGAPSTTLEGSQLHAVLSAAP